MSAWDPFLPGDRGDAVDDFKDRIRDEERNQTAEGLRVGGRVLSVDTEALDSYVGNLRAGARRLGGLGSTVPTAYVSRHVIESGAKPLVDAGFRALERAVTVLETASNETIYVYRAYLEVEATTFDGEVGISMPDWTAISDGLFDAAMPDDPLLGPLQSRPMTAAQMARSFADLTGYRRRVLGQALRQAMIDYRSIPAGPDGDLLRRRWNERLKGLGIDPRDFRSTVASIGRLRDPAATVDALEAHAAQLSATDERAATRLMAALRNDVLAITLLQPLRGAPPGSGLRNFQMRIARLAVGGVGVLDRPAALAAALRRNAGNTALAGLQRSGLLDVDVVRIRGTQVIRIGGRVLGPALTALDIASFAAGVTTFRDDNNWNRTSTVLGGSALTVLAFGAATAPFSFGISMGGALVASSVLGVASGIASLGGSVSDHRESDAVDDYYQQHEQQIDERLSDAYLQGLIAARDEHRAAAIERHFASIRSRPVAIVHTRRATAS